MERLWSNNAYKNCVKCFLKCTAIKWMMRIYLFCKHSLLQKGVLVKVAIEVFCDVPFFPSKIEMCMAQNWFPDWVKELLKHFRHRLSLRQQFFSWRKKRYCLDTSEAISAWFDGTILISTDLSYPSLIAAKWLYSRMNEIRMKTFALSRRN